MRLRTQERLSLKEIGARTGIPKSTLSGWLREAPLPDEVLKQKRGLRKGHASPLKKTRGLESKFHAMVRDRPPLTPNDKGRIAEAAVLFRLSLYGLHVMAPVFDGGCTDWLVETSSGGLVRVQVKSALYDAKKGCQPFLSLTRADGHHRRRRYSQSEFDFLAGYDLFTDTAYVFSWTETSNNRSVISVRPDAAERWDKIVSHGAVVQREDAALAVQ